jgi:hypothetical protein
MKRREKLMRRISTKILGACGAVVLGATLAAAQGPPTDKNTIVTFSAPVSLPGVTLPAGSYLFKLADSQVNRNIVQVFAEDRSKIYATILAIPAERNEPADETVITFSEAPANTAPALRYWYYPGEKRGQEFAYPKAQAVEIANAAQTSVLAVDAEPGNIESMKDAEVSRVEPGAEVTQSQTQETPAAQRATPEATAQTAQPQADTPAAPVTEQAPAAAASPQTPSTASERPAQPPSTAAAEPRQDASRPAAVGTSGRAETLPNTASPLPLIGFAGLLALGGACSLRVLRRARA